MGTGETRCPRCGAEVPTDARFCPSCGYAATRLVPGQVLDGKYEILDKLAEGGMGQVYRARHVHLDEIRIIKVTKPDPLGEGSEPRRFQEEARIATLVRHPNVAALYDFSRLPDGSFYMVWEFIDGITLEQWLERHGATPAGRALEVARQVLAGLSEIHAQGIVHRDLAPDNIMLREGPGGRLLAKIIDLGIAKRVAAETLQMTGTGLFVGKLKYCSPEQAGALPRGESVDRRSDLYSFGVVLYEMLSGRPPFEAETPEGYLGKHLHTKPPPLDTTRLPAAVGPALSSVVKRALEKNRDRRFRDAEEFRQALEVLMPAAGTAGEGTTVALAGSSRALWPTGAVAALLVVGAGIATWALVHRSGAHPAAVPEAAAPPTAAAAVPTPAPARASDSPGGSAPAGIPEAPARSRASSRSVDDASEIGLVRTPAPVTAGAEPDPTPEEAEPEAHLEAEDPRRFRAFVEIWRTLPRERKANRAMDLARDANRFVREWPDDPLAGELRQKLPASFKELAERSLDEGRNLAAARGYPAYRALDFVPSDPELDRRFAPPASPRPRGRPPGG
ncbi:MAG: protein kinase domain-containing protein [Thermoanaerobaculia bacterium]